MSVEADVWAQALAPFAKSTNETMRDAADSAVTVFKTYRGIYVQNVQLYEGLVRITTVPHQLTDDETKSLAEARITASQIAARYAEVSDLLRVTAKLAFASVIVPAPNDSDQVALDMNAAERAACSSDLRRAFGALERQKSVAGVDQAALVLIAAFNQDWRLAR